MKKNVKMIVYLFEITMSTHQMTLTSLPPVVTNHELLQKYYSHVKLLKKSKLLLRLSTHPNQLSKLFL